MSSPREIHRPSTGVGQTVTAATSTNIRPAEVFAQFRGAQHVTSGVEHFKGATFVGAGECVACHAREVEEWRTTWHAKMEQWPSAESVLGNFNDQIITYADVAVAAKDGTKSKVTFQVKTHSKDGKFFFTVLDADNPANSQTFEVAKTLGGKWDQGYEIKIGDNYFPALLRYSVKQDSWLVKTFRPEDWIEPDGTPDGRPRRAKDLPKSRVAEAKCQGCHTTGYEYREDKQAKLWKADGNGELGVSCEKCHGPASLHVAAARQAELRNETLTFEQSRIVNPVRHLDYNQQTQVCAQCHGRSGHKTEPALAFPTGFVAGDRNIQDHLRFWSYQGTSNPNETRYFYANDWAKRNRQQWQDFTKSTHYNKAGMSCLSCHTFHGKWEDMQLRLKPAQLCQSCHTRDGHALRPQSEMFAGSKMESAGVRCTDCHMARIGYRSHLTQKSSATADYPMDGSSHTFMVPTPAMKKQFGVRTACEVCHAPGRELPDHITAWPGQMIMSDAVLHKRITDDQARTRAKIGEVQAGLRALKSVPPEQAPDVERARSNVAYVVTDGSLGFHNIEKTDRLLDEALRFVDEAMRRQGAAVASSAQRGPNTSPSVASSPVPYNLSPSNRPHQTVATRPGPTDAEVKAANKHLRRASAHQGRWRYDHAISAYTEALAIDSTLAKAYSGRAWAYYKVGKAAQGLPDIEKSLALRPDDSAALDTRGHIFEALGRKADAIADFHRALTKAPNRSLSKTALHRLKAGI